MQVHSLGQEDPLEEGMAAHSTILAWRIPWTCVPHPMADSYQCMTKTHYNTVISLQILKINEKKKKESYGQRSLVGYGPWGYIE